MSASSRLLYCVNGGLANGSIPILEQSHYWGKAGWPTRFISRSRRTEFDAVPWTQLNSAEASHPEWWRQFKAEQAVFYSMRVPIPYLQAARSAGLTVTIDADSECILSPRQSLLRWHNRYRDARHSLFMRLKMVRLSCRDWCAMRSIERDVVARIDACHFLKVETPEAAMSARHLLARLKRHDLQHKLVEIPFPVRHEFLECRVDGRRDFSFAVMGRLTDQQKDPGMLLSVVRKLIGAGKNVRAVIMAREGSEPFRELAAKAPGQIEFVQGVSRAVVADFLSRSSIFLSTSRIESLPVAGLEAACAGCAIVGTPLLGYKHLCGSLGYGAHSRAHSTGDVVTAFKKVAQSLTPKMHHAIALDARSRFSLDAVTAKWTEVFRTELPK